MRNWIYQNSSCVCLTMDNTLGCSLNIALHTMFFPTFLTRADCEFIFQSSFSLPLETDSLWVVIFLLAPYVTRVIYHHGALFCVFPFGHKSVWFSSTKQYEWRSLSVHLRATSALAKLMHLNHITVQNCNSLSGFVSVTAAVIDQSDVIKHISQWPQVKESRVCVFVTHTHAYTVRNCKPEHISTMCIMLVYIT